MNQLIQMKAKFQANLISDQERKNLKGKRGRSFFGSSEFTNPFANTPKRPMGATASSTSIGTSSTPSSTPPTTSQPQSFGHELME